MTLTSVISGAGAEAFSLDVLILIWDRLMSLFVFSFGIVSVIV
jgi:hypothetical protein